MDIPPTKLPPEQLAALAAEDQSPKVLALVITFTSLAFICVILRFFTRLNFTKLVGWEDYFIAASMVKLSPGRYFLSIICLSVRQIFSIATMVCQVRQVQFGSGKHQPLVHLSSTIKSLQVTRPGRLLLGYYAY